MERYSCAVGAPAKNKSWIGSGGTFGVYAHTFHQSQQKSGGQLRGSNRRCGSGVWKMSKFHNFFHKLGRSRVLRNLSQNGPRIDKRSQIGFIQSADVGIELIARNILDV